MKLFFLLVAVSLATPIRAQELVPLGKLLDGAQQAIQKQCENTKAQLNRSSSEEQKVALKHAIDLNCNCFPSELQRVAQQHGGMQSEIPASKDQAMSIASSAYSACAARGLRAQIKPLCMRDDKAAAGISDRTSYCACVADSLDKVEDEKLTEAAMKAHSNFQKKVDARSRGEADPKMDETVIDAATSACRAKFLR